MKVKHLLHCHLLVTGLSPELAAGRWPVLESLLALSRPEAAVDGGAESWLCRAGGVARQSDWPIAPFAALGEELVPGRQYWLRADPVHLHLLRDRLVLDDGTPTDIPMQEAEALVATLNRHFAETGLHFYAPHASRWYLRLDMPPALKTHPLADAVGRDVNQLLPQGADAMHWHGWLNEVQMLLHEHPVNLAREQRGQLPVNSVWLWGGGVLSQPGEMAFKDIWAGNRLAQGLVRAHGRQAQLLPVSADEWLHGFPAAGAHLMVLDQLDRQLEQQWFAPLLRNLKSGRVASLHLHLAEAARVRSFVLQRADLWKFWRRSKPLEVFLHG